MISGAVLFDLDNTLHDRIAGLVAFLEAQYAHQKLWIQRIDREDWVQNFLSFDQNGRVWKDEVYRQLCSKFKLALDPNLLLSEYETGFAQHVVPLDGLIEMLQELGTRNWRTGIITNGRSEFQRATLKSLNIEPWLDVVFVSEECGLRKPNPLIFQLALTQLGCEAQNSWFVGDDLTADIEGAYAADMQAIWFKPLCNPTAETLVATITHLTEVPGLVGSPGDNPRSSVR